MLRTWRTKLRRRYFNKYKTNAKRLANVPPFVKREQWREFVEKESMTDAKRKSELGKVNRSKIGATHTSGRSGQAQVEYNLMEKKKDGQPEPTRVEVWIESHTSKDDTIPTSLAPQMDKVKAKQKELMQNASENIDQSTSLACDALSHVFGKDTRGRTRGVGSTVSRSSIEASLPAVYLLETERVEGREVKGRLNQLEKYVKDMNTSISNELCNIKTLLSATVRKSPTRDGASATHGASSSSNAEHGLLDDGIICEIKGFNGRVIGKGRVDGSHREIVHNHVVDYKEEVLLIIDVIFDPNACIYLGQQGCAENLGDLGSGGYVVWLKSLVKPIS
ncbi:hypothetical protein LguiB_022407 [Lonicera macranthoides]